jgi:Icc-related predicted phosphoesterase
MRIAAIGDIHCTRKSHGAFRALFTDVSRSAQVLLLCGDLTDYGLIEEAHVLAGELAAVRIPILAVLGNHDYESGKQDQVQEILVEAGVTVLDGDACEIGGVGFVGAKGFAGGFEGRSLEPWGEPTIKRFVHEAVDEALKLEAALSRLACLPRVAILHYAPVRETVIGEPPEIYPFLGSRRLEEPLTRFGVSLVFHGHAHQGSPRGELSSGAPVYNVALPLLRRLSPGALPYRLVELPLGGERSDASRVPAAPVPGQPFRSP